MTGEVRFPVLVLSWIAVAAVSVGVAWLAAFRPVGDPTQADARESSYAVTRSEFSDERPVELNVTPAPDRPLIVRGSGVLTVVDCEVGQRWASGASVVAVGGGGLLLLGAKEPWHRDLALGDEGEDVVNLQHALGRLGPEVAASGRFDAATQVVWKKIAAEAGVPAPDGVFRLSRVVWLPEDEVTITQCPLAAGQDVAAGATIAMAESGFATVSFDVPLDLFEGPRTLSVGATTVTLDEDVRLFDPETVRAVVATAEVSAAISQGAGEIAPVGATLRLATPVRVYAVPPSSLVTDASARVCVLSGGSPVMAEVVSSALGLTYVKLEGNPPPAVDVYPARDATCSS